MNTTMMCGYPGDPARARRSEMPGREHYRGYGIMAQPFESGHVLALRVFHETDHGPFAAVWHRTPGGAWSMYVDAEDPDIFCPRFFGPILRESGKARISVQWPRGDRLEIRVDEPALEWSVRLRSSVLTRLANRILPRLPLELYAREATLTLVQALADRALGLGPVDLEGTLPAGQGVLVQPRRLFLVGEARASFGGVDLGAPSESAANPTTGSFRWPGKGVLAQGDVYLEAEVSDRVARRRRPRTVQVAGTR